MLRSIDFDTEQVWTQSSVEVSLAGIKSDRRIAFLRGLPQGAPESTCNLCGCLGLCIGKAG